MLHKKHPSGSAKNISHAGTECIDRPVRPEARSCSRGQTSKTNTTTNRHEHPRRAVRIDISLRICMHAFEHMLHTAGEFSSRWFSRNTRQPLYSLNMPAAMPICVSKSGAAAINPLSATVRKLQLDMLGMQRNSHDSNDSSRRGGMQLKPPRGVGFTVPSWEA